MSSLRKLHSDLIAFSDSISIRFVKCTPKVILTALADVITVGLAMPLSNKKPINNVDRPLYFYINQVFLLIPLIHLQR